MDALQERFERWAHEDEGIALSLLEPHPTPERATYLSAIVDGMWRGFKGHHALMLSQATAVQPGEIR
jgi:hypothetical protein